MSQSDYIRYKKLSNQLLEVNKLDPILNSQDYTNFKQYYLESNIINTNPKINNLLLSGYNTIFNMNKKINYCPIHNFTMCNHTQIRPNRIISTNRRTDAYETSHFPIKVIIK
jgi:hypothetical protein